jgi:HEAT repeat protein
MPMAQNVKWRWMSKFSFLFFVSLYLWLLLTGSAIAQDTRSPASVLTEAVEKAKPLTRGEFLSLLVTESPFDAGLLMRGLGSGDPLARKLAAVQLGEIGPDRINSQVMAALINGVRDSDEGVAKQAIASIIRIGRVAPDVLLSFVADKTPLREFTYDSVEANSERTLKITVSDLAITGLYYADGVKLNGIVSAYRDARRKEPKIAATDHAKGSTRRASRLRLFTEGTPVGPGTSDYFAHALSALLTRSPNINLQLILGLLGDEDTRLRKIAYSAAGMVTLDRAKVISRLKSIVRGVPADSDRFDAAEALASQGTQGRAELMNLARFSSRPSRAAAVASLVSNGDCTSPFLLLAVADSDSYVRRAGLTALLSKNWNTSFKCLAPLVCGPKARTRPQETHFVQFIT